MGWTFSHIPETKEEALERIAPLAGWDHNGGRVTFERVKWTAEGCWGVVRAGLLSGYP